MKPHGIAVAIVALVIAISSVAAAGNHVHETVVTRWVDPHGSRPTTYEEYMAGRIVTPLEIDEVKMISSAGDTTQMMIVVNDDLYPQITASLQTYIQDLESEGYQVAVATISGGTPTELRNYLVLQWDMGIAGIVLIGDLPVPWFELYEDFHNDGPDDTVMVGFPIDLFYMDLDGAWYDEDGDNKFDVHEGNCEPDIWLGRLLASPLSGDEATLIADYFQRNHQYRTGALDLPFRSLCYIDDDWAAGAAEWIEDLEKAYGYITPVIDINQTTDDDYRSRLLEGQFDHLLLAAHSSPQFHSFKENDGSGWGHFYNYEIAELDPAIFFYNLFACSNCRYVESNYMGGCYIFSPSYGLGAVGSTKTGSMLYFGDFYGPLGSGVHLGEAFRSWFALHGNDPEAIAWSRSWFYGMTLLGDPTLVLHLGLKFSALSVDDDQNGASSGDGDGSADVGEILELSIDIHNFNNQAYHQVVGSLDSDDEYVMILDSVGSFGTLSPRGSATATDFVVAIAQVCPDGHRASLSLRLTDDGGHSWLDKFKVLVNAPRLELLAADYADESGNGLIEPGERVRIIPTLVNRGGEDSPEVAGALDCPGGQVAILSGDADFDPLTPGGNGDARDTLWVEVDSASSMETTPFLRLTLISATAELGQRYFSLPIGSTLTLRCNMEENPDGLVSYAVGEGFADDWHRSSWRRRSGSFSRKFGGPGAGHYSALADGALETPLFPLWTDAQLTFWHWIDAEVGYDGGIVEIDVGEGWSQIEPEGGYPHRSVSNGSFPKTDCYAGQSGWSTADFDLSEYSGWCRLRFRFGSDGGLQREGWYIDDIKVTGAFADVAPNQISGGIPREYELLQNYPNPFNSTTEIRYVLPREGPVKIEIFNVLGQLVRTLVNGRQPAGHESVTWDGRDDRGGEIASGIYLYQISAGGYRSIRKTVLIR